MISIVFLPDMQAQFDLYSVYARPVSSVGSLQFHTRPVGSIGSRQCLCKTCRLSLISRVFIRDLQAQLDLYRVHTRMQALLDIYSLFARNVVSVGSLQFVCETCRLSWFSIVFMRDLQAQFDLQIVYTRPVGSGWIFIVFIRDMQFQLDLYSVYTRPVGSVGSLQCSCETCSSGWIIIVCIRALQAHLDLDSIYARSVGSVGS